MSVDEPMYLAFRTGLSLPEVARQLGAAVTVQDYENEYEWVVADVDGVAINVSRLHTVPPVDTDTAIYLDRDPRAPLPVTLRDTLAARLTRLGITPLYAGSWEYEPGAELPHKVERRLA